MAMGNPIISWPHVAYVSVHIRIGNRYEQDTDILWHEFDTSGPASSYGAVVDANESVLIGRIENRTTHKQLAKPA